MFWAKKIACDNCNKKVKEKDSVYRRGSRFCGDACRDAYDVAHPPTVARGDAASVKQELVICLDEAFTEAKRRWGDSANIPSGFTVSVSVGALSLGTGGMTGLLGSIDAKHHAEQMQEAFMQFQTHVYRSGPLLRALGYKAEADMIDSTEFEKVSAQPLIEALVKVRQQL